MKVLIVGKGGREHALAWKIAQSPLLTKLFVAPGNGGTEHYKNYNVGIEITDIKGLRRFAIKEKIDLTIVGSEESLILGIADTFQAEGLKIFGPTKKDAELETSKVFSKDFMRKYDIPTAPFEVFSDYHKALEYIAKKKFPLVIKADGLAKGKGVKVCFNDLDATSFLQDLIINKMYGNAGNSVLIEEFLEGEEYSAHALYDKNKNIIQFPMAQDYKTLNGENTGGMGAIAPVLTGSKNFMKEFLDVVIKPTISWISVSNGGCIYPGIIITPNGLRVLEFNMRFGDPETQVYMRLLKSDLLEILLACAEGRLSEIKIEWHKNLHAICVVLASKGYPGKYKTGFQIKNARKVNGLEGVKVFHAGTARENGKPVTAGGRVLNVTATGDTLEEARSRVYDAVDEIYFEGMQYRKDIGLELSPYQGT